MDKNEIYQKIKDIAEHLQNESSTFTRADLAYELKELGISQDTADVGMLVWEAYNFYNNNWIIRDVFLDNDGKTTLVSEYEVDWLLEQRDDNALFPLVENRLQISKVSLDKLDNAITTAMTAKGGQTTRTLLNTITGTHGIVKAKDEATAVFNGYSRLVGHYDEAKVNVKSTIADFVKLRTQVCDIYRQYSIILTDIFGDSIKAVSPELFDFEQIEWLDVQGMLQNIQLDYNRMTEKCGVLMSEISENFVQSFKTASGSYRESDNKKAGLIMAGLGMLSHYVNAADKAAMMQQELLMLKNSVKHDVTLIKGDLGRLMVIYKTLNDLYIPQAETVSRYSGKVFDNEWEALENALYGNEQIRGMKDERDMTLASIKELERYVADEQMNIAYYTSKINETQQLLESVKPKYEEAKSTQPHKPNFLVNIITFGTAGKSYNRNIYEWNMACAPVVTQYVDLQTDVNLDSEELSKQKKLLRDHQGGLKVLKASLRNQNRNIVDCIQVDQKTKLQMLPHLEAIIKLLRTAKEVASGKLDDRLTHTVTIESRKLELPQDIRQSIEEFTMAMKEQIKLQSVSQDEELPVSQDEEQPLSQNEEEVAFDKGMDMVAQSAAGLLNSCLQLQEMRRTSAIADDQYNRELKRLQHGFMEDIRKIDDKSALLRECMKKANMAQNSEQLKNALLSLAGKDADMFSDGDWNEFLKGNKTIEL